MSGKMGGDGSSMPVSSSSSGPGAAGEGRPVAVFLEGNCVRVRKEEDAERLPPIGTEPGGHEEGLAGCGRRGHGGSCTPIQGNIVELWHSGG